MIPRKIVVGVSLVGVVLLFTGLLFLFGELYNTRNTVLGQFFVSAIVSIIFVGSITALVFLQRMKQNLIVNKPNIQNEENK